MAKCVPWVTLHSHICQTEINYIFLSHKFKIHTKQEQLYEVPARHRYKNQPKRWAPDVLAQMAG